MGHGIGMWFLEGGVKNLVNKMERKKDGVWNTNNGSWGMEGEFGDCGWSVGFG